MATHEQRAITICGALLNSVATPTQRDRISKAFAASLPPDATTAQIAEQFIKKLRHYVIGEVTSYETAAGVTAIREAKAAQVPLDFTEAP